ncbi:MAG TPA: DUF2889 domain-containing protein, partial [Acidimicrobiales bacterium]|nr:DUF2889 domain-containing protein [Acidimicrobiales bacterium]
SPGSGPARRGPGIDVCAGWQTGGMLVECLAEGGTIPHSLGPPAPVLAVADDPLAWHDRPPVRPLVTRRTRRLDVVSPVALGPVRIDAHFRDSYGFTDGTERSLHEYTIEAEVDSVSRTVTSAQAVPRALPWPECPQAADSAARLGGLVLDDLAELVRRQFTGITTCTHLNDTMRSLADGAALLGLATSGTPGAGQQRARG